MMDIKPEHWHTISAILSAHLQPNTKVWVFGSRAKHTARPFSDVDLALDSTKPLSIHTMADLAADFEDSDLPYKVDLVDLARTSPSFRRAISSHWIYVNFHNTR